MSPLWQINNPIKHQTGIKKPSPLTGRFNSLLYIPQLTLPPLPLQPHRAILKGMLLNHKYGKTVNLRRLAHAPGGFECIPSHPPSFGNHFFKYFCTFAGIINSSSYPTGSAFFSSAEIYCKSLETVASSLAFLSKVIRYAFISATSRL